MAAPASNIKVEGLKETVRALGKVNKEAKKTLLLGLRKGAEPIAVDARSRLDAYGGLSTTTIRPRTSYGAVYVTQRKGKVTGTRPDFGALQVRKGLWPAAVTGQPLLWSAVEDAFDSLITKAGF